MVLETNNHRNDQISPSPSYLVCILSRALIKTVDIARSHTKFLIKRSFSAPFFPVGITAVGFLPRKPRRGRMKPRMKQPWLPCCPAPTLGGGCVGFIHLAGGYSWCLSAACSGHGLRHRAGGGSNMMRGVIFSHKKILSGMKSKLPNGR